MSNTLAWLVLKDFRSPFNGSLLRLFFFFQSGICGFMAACSLIVCQSFYQRADSYFKFLIPGSTAAQLHPRRRLLYHHTPISSASQDGAGSDAQRMRLMPRGLIRRRMRQTAGPAEENAWAAVGDVQRRRPAGVRAASAGASPVPPPSWFIAVACCSERSVHCCLSASRLRPRVGALACFRTSPVFVSEGSDGKELGAGLAILWGSCVHLG